MDIEEQIELETEVDSVEEVDDSKSKNLKSALLVAAGVAAVIVVLIVVTTNKPAPNVLPTPIGNPTGLATDKNELIQNAKYLAGEIQNISLLEDGRVGVLTIKAAVQDVSSAEVFIEPVDRVYSEKEFSIRFDGNTVFENKSAGDLVLGDVVKIDTTESIYLSDNLLAEQVVFHNQQAENMKQVSGNPSLIFGVVKVKEDNSLVISAEVVDREVLDQMDLSGSYVVPKVTKDFVVEVNDNTKIEGNRDDTLAGIAVGDGVVVTTAVDIYQNSTFSALQITLVPSDDEDY